MPQQRRRPRPTWTLGERATAACSTGSSKSFSRFNHSERQSIPLGASLRHQLGPNTRRKCSRSLLRCLLPSIFDGKRVWVFFSSFVVRNHDSSRFTYSKLRNFPLQRCASLDLQQECIGFFFVDTTTSIRYGLSMSSSRCLFTSFAAQPVSQQRYPDRHFFW